MFRLLLAGTLLVLAHAAALADDAPQSVSEWRDVVWARLAHFSNIPPETVDRPGIYQCEITITVRNDGIVTRSELARSSGSDELDENALRIPQMASPLPPFPPDAPYRTMMVTLPVVYSYPSKPPRTAREMRRQGMTLPR